jgi:hypothetical protein
VNSKLRNETVFRILDWDQRESLVALKAMCCNTSQASNTDYAAATSVSQTFTVSKAALMVTANNL